MILELGGDFTRLINDWKDRPTVVGSELELAANVL
jgi:hypothetical protein